MGRIVVTEFVSLDGVVEAPGGGEGFRHDGWSFEIDRGDEGNQFKLEETMSSEALLLGRKTYEGFADAWPAREGEFADKFNNMPKYVVSSTLKDPDWSNTTVLDGDPVEAVSKLKQDFDGELTVHGSAQLVQTLLDNDLVDELHVDVNARDHEGNTALHDAAARGDVPMIEYLVSKGADVKAVNRAGETTADMANSPVSRIEPYPEALALLVKLGAKNNGKCKACS